MKIGVISDTHASNLSDIPVSVLRALENVDLIIHAGDFTDKTVLDGLRNLGDVKAVCGNMDSGEIKRMLSPKETFTANGKRIGLTHGSGARLGIATRIRDMFDDADMIVYGHSHEPDSQTIRGILMFNPGPVRRSFGMITIDQDIKTEIITV